MGQEAFDVNECYHGHMQRLKFFPFLCIALLGLCIAGCKPFKMRAKDHLSNTISPIARVVKYRTLREEEVTNKLGDRIHKVSFWAVLQIEKTDDDARALIENSREFKLVKHFRETGKITPSAMRIKFGGLSPSNLREWNLYPTKLSRGDRIRIEGVASFKWDSELGNPFRGFEIKSVVTSPRPTNKYLSMFF